ncbi:cytochrome c [Paenibacillus sp. JMULE4]|uniref:c-type cytochrome n=1 Tax=Paenibacillus sp. JMULE4 TaxID=2518342 RepID=UPI001576B4DD|nr:cytochrome c [Paenibacillus sp. JMULE4]NTZ20337.1 cytochrome c [Paenibacillus sp. JMULE4]
MKRMNTWVAFSMALMMAAVLGACTPQNSPAPFGGGKSSGGMTEEQAMAGASDTVQSLYKQNCMSCHASNLEGKVGPNTNLQQAGARLTKEQIVEQINRGGNGMPGYQGKLKTEEIDALADWLANKK